MSKRQSIRDQVWEELRKVARPDSRFHWDFSMFIPDYEGSEKAAERLRQIPIYRQAKLAMITPDNNLISLRKFLLEDEKAFLMPTYGIVRNFIYMSAENLKANDFFFAATLDGAEEFGRFVNLVEIQKLGSIDFMVTGASAVNLEGVRYGKGHGYFDLEWALFREVGVVNEDTPVIVMVHDCQIINTKFPISRFDTIGDFIVTPTRTIEIKKQHPKPKGIFWDQLSGELLGQVPAVEELRKLKKR